MSTARINEFTKLLSTNTINISTDSDTTSESDSNDTTILINDNNLGLNADDAAIDIIYDIQNVNKCVYEENGVYHRFEPFKPDDTTINHLQTLKKLEYKYTKKST